MWGMEISRYYTFNQGEVQSHPSKLTGMILFVINDTIVFKKNARYFSKSFYGISTNLNLKQFVTPIFCFGKGTFDALCNSYQLKSLKALLIERMYLILF